MIHIRKIIVLLILISSFTSCKKMLEEVAKSEINKNQFFENEAQCVAAINGCYSDLIKIYTHNLFKAIEGTSDLAFYGVAADPDGAFGISPANPGAGEILWPAAYHGIMTCNATIAGIERSPLNDEKKKKLKAEAITLRGLYYYFLTSMFGDVPFYVSEIEDFDDLEVVATTGRMSAIETRNYLIDELNEYASALPNEPTSQVPENRISSSVAYMLVAKMALWNKRYDVGLTALKKVMGVYGSLQKYPLEDILFSKKNTDESIFEVQFMSSSTGLNKTTLVSAITMPPRKSATSIYDGVDIPELGDKASPSTSITPSDYLVDIFDKNPFDLRINLVLGREFNGEWFNRPSRDNFMGKPWMGPKFWCFGMDNKLDGNNQRVFRYADALLMAAECSNELDDPDEAVRYINMTKIRAQIALMDVYPGKEIFFQELKEERARELMGEYGRKWDLVRWGIFYESILATIAKENDQISSNVKPYHEFYPIPDTEVFRSKGVLTNDKYK